MKGKVADVVMSVRNGNQIVRKYQPMVYNPSTPGQVAARAKLKLLSQLSASMAAIIAMPKMGLVSPRNQFTKVNYSAASYNEASDPQTASIALADVKITKSSVFLPALSVSASGTEGTASLANTEEDLDKVVYCYFAVLPNQSLRLARTSVVSTGGNFTDTFPTTVGYKYAIYAYGIRINSEAARARFENLGVNDATRIASLIASRVITESDITLTETRYASLDA